MTRPLPRTDSFDIRRGIAVSAFIPILTAAFLSTGAAPGARTQTPPASPSSDRTLDQARLRRDSLEPAGPVSRADLRAAIDRGVAWLLANQNSNAWWSTPEQPGVTALVLTALNREPSGRFTRTRPSELSRAYEFILGSVKPDGSIYRSGLANYNTSLSLLALTTADDPRFLPVIRNAREYLAGTQTDFGEPGRIDTPFDGGVGYGSKYQHSDMNNTLTAIEAMRWSESALPKDAPEGAPGHADLNWAAVARFLQNCQNLKAHNPAEWVSDDPRDRGGFVYYPGHTKAESITNAKTGRVSLRSYGSISYAGLLSYIYAKVDRDDPRVLAVLDWLRNNYTLEENPGLGQQGYYYYLHLMTKALTAARVETLKVTAQPTGELDATNALKAGAIEEPREIPWRDEVARRLLSLQQPDGSWVNENERWWESDRCLVTAYVLLSLEMLHDSLQEG
jgi:squalene-hopene/tetraprenyl-beta-curcumene cyclase